MLIIFIFTIATIAVVTLAGISVFTDTKVPIIDSYIANLIDDYSIKEKRKKNNLVCKGWKMTHYDLDGQDIRWIYKVDDRLVAKLRIKYSKVKESYTSHYSKWIDHRRDVLEEVVVIGEPKFLLKLFGLSTRVYQVIDISKKPNLKKIFGNVDHPIIMMRTNLKQDS